MPHMLILIHHNAHGTGFGRAISMNIEACPYSCHHAVGLCAKENFYGKKLNPNIEESFKSLSSSWIKI